MNGRKQLLTKRNAKTNAYKKYERDAKLQAKYQTNKTEDVIDEYGKNGDIQLLVDFSKRNQKSQVTPLEQLISEGI